MTNVHVSSHYRCDSGEVFVEAHDYDETIANWNKVKFPDSAGRKLIKCRWPGCGRPARLMDCHFPWMTDACRCEDHDDFTVFPLTE